MPCYTPLQAYRSQGGQIVFDSKKGWSDRPLELACGQCIGCRQERARQWAIRAVHESEMHKENCFVTLTYSKVPRHAADCSGCRGVFGSLCVRDWQLFAKALRNRVGPFRFLMCGEYGERSGRAHFHACIFGHNFRMDGRAVSRKSGHPLWTSDVVVSAWKRGHVSIGQLTYESAEYVARYVMKKLTGERSKEYGGKKPPFINASRNPGLGATWFDKYVDDVYPGDEVRYFERRFRPPRFYDGKLSEELLLSLKAKRLSAARKRQAELEPGRLKDRERFAEARLSHFGRNLDNE